MRALPATLFVITAFAVAAPNAAAQECDDPRTFADRFWTLTFGSAIRSDATTGTGQEQAVGGGVLDTFGCGGQWMARAELTTGFSSTSRAFFDAVFGGVQLALARAFARPRVELGEDNLLEWYLLAGGGAYAVHDMPEAPGESALVPDLAAALGVRVTSVAGEANLMFIELLREERFGRFDPRWYLRWAISWPM